MFGEKETKCLQGICHHDDRGYMLFENVKIIEEVIGNRDPKETINHVKKDKYGTLVGGAVTGHGFFGYSKIRDQLNTDLKKLIIKESEIKGLHPYNQFGICQGEHINKNSYEVQMEKNKINNVYLFYITFPHQQANQKIKIIDNYGNFQINISTRNWATSKSGGIVYPIDNGEIEISGNKGIRNLAIDSILPTKIFNNKGKMAVNLKYNKEQDILKFDLNKESKEATAEFLNNNDIARGDFYKILKNHKDTINDKNIIKTFQDIIYYMKYKKVPKALYNTWKIITNNSIVSIITLIASIISIIALLL